MLTNVSQSNYWRFDLETDIYGDWVQTLLDGVVAFGLSVLGGVEDLVDLAI